MIRAIAFALLALSGCAGQYAITKPGDITTSQFVAQPTPPSYGSVVSGGPVWSYFDAPTYGVFYVENASEDEFVTQAHCVDGFTSDLDIPPHTGQRILVVTTMNRARNGLCKVDGLP